MPASSACDAVLGDGDTAVTERLAAKAEAAHDEFIAAVEGLDAQQRSDPSLVGDWGVNEVTAHLGYWVGMTAEALHHAELDRTSAFTELDMDVDARNAIVARVARETDPATVRFREEIAFGAFVDRLRHADPAWLDERTADDQTILQLIEEDTIDHYREHTAELRAAAEAHLR
jgi:hypothetical protein